MPGPYIHISSMRHAAEGIARGGFAIPGSERIDPKWPGPTGQELARLMREHPNFAAIGAVGPDLFFFLPDFRDVEILGQRVKLSSVLVKVLDFLEGMYTFVDDHFLSKWEHYLGPISEDTAEEMSRLTGGLSEVVGDITGELSGILITLLEDFLVTQKDWWEFFSLGLDKGYDEQAYFWSDMLHYRQTGEFGRTLWRLANGEQLPPDADPEQESPVAGDGARAYALGYVSHLATDVTGHAFVNQISGGPFRLHWQRHHLVENHMDCEWYLADPLTPAMGDQYPQLTESALYYDVAFDEADGSPVDRPAYPTGNTLRENWERRRKLDLDSDLGDPIPDLLLAAIETVFYADGVHPKILAGDGKPTTDEINEAFKLFFRYLKLSTVDGFSHEPPPPPDLFPNLDFPTIGDPSDDPPGEGDGDGDFWDDLLDFLLAVISVLAYIVEVVVYLATLPWAILADIATYPLRLALYWTLELGLFHLLKNFRMVLVMTGYLHPMADEIAPTLTNVGLADPRALALLFGEIDDIFGGTHEDDRKLLGETYRDRLYPRQHPQDEFRHPWDYPATPVERDPTTAGPHHLLAPPGDLFVDRSADAQVRDALEAATTPQEADQVGHGIDPSRNLGDAVGFSKYLLWLETREGGGEGRRPHPVDWNLDADRGYGYHCWDWDRWSEAAKRTFDDPEGNAFREPCTWPPQADPVPWDVNRRLALHWAGPGLEDPGCAEEASAAPRARRRRPAAGGRGDA